MASLNGLSLVNAGSLLPSLLTRESLIPSLDLGISFFIGGSLLLSLVRVLFNEVSLKGRFNELFVNKLEIWFLDKLESLDLFVSQEGLDPLCTPLVSSGSPSSSPPNLKSEAPSLVSEAPGLESEGSKAVDLAGSGLPNPALSLLGNDPSN